MYNINIGTMVKRDDFEKNKNKINVQLKCLEVFKVFKNIPGTLEKGKYLSDIHLQGEGGGGISNKSFSCF